MTLSWNPTIVAGLSLFSLGIALLTAGAVI
jgi:hypothetical protein